MPVPAAGFDHVISVGWRGRVAEALLVLTALFAFVFSLAKDAPIGVVVFASVYLLAVAITVLPRWRGRHSTKATTSRELH